MERAEPLWTSISRRESLKMTGETRVIEASIKQTDKGIKQHSNITPHDGRKNRRDALEFLTRRGDFALLDALPVAIYMADADGQISFLIAL